jgi:hypothetical protein
MKAELEAFASIETIKTIERSTFDHQFLDSLIRKRECIFGLWTLDTRF